MWVQCSCQPVGVTNKTHDNNMVSIEFHKRKNLIGTFFLKNSVSSRNIQVFATPSMLYKFYITKELQDHEIPKSSQLNNKMRQQFTSIEWEKKKIQYIKMQS